MLLMSSEETLHSRKGCHHSRQQEEQYGGQNTGGLILVEAPGVSVGHVAYIIGVKWLAGDVKEPIHLLLG